MGKSQKELEKAALCIGLKLFEMSAACGAIKSLWFWTSKTILKRSICTGPLPCQAVDAVRQAERLASQWQKRAEQAEMTKEEIKETRKDKKR